METMIMEESVKLMPDRQNLSELQVRIDQNPNDADAWSQIGFILLEEGKPTEAKPILEKVVELNPKDFKAWAGLGVIAANRKDLKNAEEFYRRAVKIEPRFTDGWFGLARVYWGEAKYNDSEKALKNCTFDTTEGRLMVLRELAIVYMLWKKPSKAEKPLMQAIQLDPANPEFKIMMHRVLLEQKKNRDKENQAILILREIPIGTMPLEELVKASGQALQFGDFIAATNFGLRIRELDPENIDGLFICHRHLRERYNFHYARMCTPSRVSTDGWETKNLSEEIKKIDAKVRSITTSNQLAKERWRTLTNQYPLETPYMYNL